ncbi:hypothetical protein AB0J21_33295 [Streptomyces sp. NPDC049954]|uniref:hypothetical protein n=1 Tax=Streptomyces sp. NPDC049954 TaxID=3155779 RepID=UPI003434BBEB
MSVIVRRLGDALPPGFTDFAEFFASWKDEFWAYGKDDVKNDYNSIVFGGTSADDQLRIMNQPEFRLLHNLLPAGTTPVAAFCQIYSLKYRRKMQTLGISGLYTIKFTLWPSVSAEPLGMNATDFAYKLYGRDRGTVPVTVALPPLVPVTE